MFLTLFPLTCFLTLKCSLSNLKTMEGGCKPTTDSLDNHVLGNACNRQMGLGEAISEGLVKIHQLESSEFSSEMNLRSSERLICCVKAQKDPYGDTRHETLNKRFVKSAKEPKALPLNNENIYHLDGRTIELLRSILATTEMNQVTTGSSTLAAGSPHASPEINLELENFKVRFNPSKTLHLPRRSCAHSNEKSAVGKLIQKPSSQDSLSNKSKGKAGVRSDQRLSSEGRQLDFLEALKKKLQQKDVENQQIARLLLLKHQELRDVKEKSKLRDVEAQLMAERLNCEKQKNAEVTKRFDNACEDLRKKLSAAKCNNEGLAQQLKALLEKYERLQTRANTIKDQFLEERTKRKSSQKTVKKIQQMAEELLRNQTLLETQRDMAAKELSVCRQKVKIMEEEHKKNIRAAQRAEEERSATQAQYKTLRHELYETQEENKKLMRSVQSIELEKERAEEHLQESQNVLKQLNAELDESKMQRESIHQLLEATKKEIKLIRSRNQAEKLQLQEQQKAYMKLFEDTRMQCEALNEVVSKLKKDKVVLKEELQCLQKDKAKAETVSKCEGERLRETVSLLERERELILEEMRDLRKDYFSLSDRITQRLGQLDQTDAPMCITDISSFHQNRAPNTGTVPITPSMDSKYKQQGNNSTKSPTFPIFLS